MLLRRRTRSGLTTEYQRDHEQTYGCAHGFLVYALHFVKRGVKRSVKAEASLTGGGRLPGTTQTSAELLANLAEQVIRAGGAMARGEGAGSCHA